MADIALANSSSNLTGKEVTTTAGTHTVTGPWTFDRDPNAPFSVSASSAKVTNLDADLLDGQEGSYYTNATNLASGTVPDARLPGVTSNGSGKIEQLAFAATQDPSTDANTLDDYEEGSWTPVIGGSGGTSGQAYTTQVGRYVKIGKLVTAQFTATLSTEGTITTSVQIQGLPFTAENVASLFSVSSLVFSGLATNWISVLASVQPNTTTANVVGLQAAGAANTTNLTAADIGNTSLLAGTITYRADA